jgi:putative transposase
VNASSERLKGDERILGDSAFVQEMLSRTEERRISAGGPTTKMTLEELAARIQELYGIGLDVLRGKSRRSLSVEARSLFCFFAVREGRFPAAVVAAYLGMTAPGVGYAVERGGRGRPPVSL